MISVKHIIHDFEIPVGALAGRLPASRLPARQARIDFNTFIRTWHDGMLKHPLWYTKSIQYILSILICLACFAIPPTYAAPVGTDIFSTTTPGAGNPRPQSSQPQQTVGAGALSMMSGKTPVVGWFEKFDALRAQYRPSSADRVILTRPLLQESERVKQWSDTASKVARNYTTLAKTLRNLAIPSGLSDVRQYRDLTADWYQDSAAVYSDLIRPRTPAKTIEELQGQLDEVKKRSENLAATIGTLNNMDQDLRKHYKVHLAIQDDALQQYVKGN